MRRAKPERGFVLLVTLWVLVILGVLLTNLGYQVRVEAAVELEHEQQLADARREGGRDDQDGAAQR